MIFAGKLDTPIRIEAKTIASQDAHGMPVKTWAKVQGSPSRAQYMPLRGSEAIEAQKITANVMFKLRIRRYGALTTAHRVVIDGKYADIKAIEDNRRGQDMVVWCEVKE